MTIAELSLKRPVTAIMLFVSMIVIGLIAALRLPLEQFPSLDVAVPVRQHPVPGFDADRGRAHDHAPGRGSAVDADRHPAHELDIRRRERADLPRVQVGPEHGDQGRARRARRSTRIRADLPSDLQRYTVQKFSTSDQPILKLRVASESGVDISNAYDLLDHEIKRPLERMPGVARVDLKVSRKREVQIELSIRPAERADVGLNDLYQRLQTANFSISAGQIKDGGTRFHVQPVGQWHSVDEIRGIPINDKGLKPRRHRRRQRQAGAAHLRAASRRTSGDRRRHLPERTANLVDVGTQVLAAIDHIQKSPELHGIHVFLIDNQAASVTESLRELGKAGIEGTMLSVLVLFFFLRDWPSTLMVSLSIPICFVITLGCM